MDVATWHHPLFTGLFILPLGVGDIHGDELFLGSGAGERLLGEGCSVLGEHLTTSSDSF